MSRPASPPPTFGERFYRLGRESGPTDGTLVLTSAHSKFFGVPRLYPPCWEAALML